MKSAYELAMERLAKQTPSVKISEKQKGRLAELESQCKAKVAERELFLQGELEKAINSGDGVAVEQIQTQMVSERKSIRANFEEKKDKVRQQSS